MSTRLLIRVSLALAATVLAAGEGRTQPLTMSAPTTQGAPGQEVDIPISFTGPPGIGAMHLELVYDPAILECKTVEKGPLLAGNSLLEFDVSRPGRLVVGAVSLDGISSEGAVVKARFVARGSVGQKTLLRLERVQAWDGKTHLDALAKVEAGEFTVTEAGRQGLTPWLLGIGAAVLALFITLAAVHSHQRSPSA